jgi:hypothetical protein
MTSNDFINARLAIHQKFASLSEQINTLKTEMQFLIPENERRLLKTLNEIEEALSLLDDGENITLTSLLHKLAELFKQEKAVKAEQSELDCQLKTKMTINDIINARLYTRHKLADLSKQEKALKAEQSELDWQLMTKLDDQGLSRTANDTATISISEEVVPEVQDWDELYQYITSTGDFSLVQRRMSSTAYRELRGQGDNVPGVADRTIRKLNVRAL